MLADKEGLTAHRYSVDVRLESIEAPKGPGGADDARHHPPGRVRRLRVDREPDPRAGGLREAGTRVQGHARATSGRTSSARRPYAEALIAEWDGEAVGFALYFQNYSTFHGQAGHLSGRPVRPARRDRGQGLGKALLARLARIAVERDCGRFEWVVLDWNEPSIGVLQGRSAPGRWTTGRCTASTGRRWRSWRRRIGERGGLFGVRFEEGNGLAQAGVVGLDLEGAAESGEGLAAEVEAEVALPEAGEGADVVGVALQSLAAIGGALGEFLLGEERDGAGYKPRRIWGSGR